MASRERAVTYEEPKIQLINAESWREIFHYIRKTKLKKNVDQVSDQCVIRKDKISYHDLRREVEKFKFNLFHNKGQKAEENTREQI